MASGTSDAHPGADLPSLAADGPVSYAIVRLAKTHKVVAAVLLRELGLYPGQELLLMHLWDSDRQTQAELVRALRLDASTVAKMAARLEQQRIVHREASATDRRTVTVSLTPHGIALCKQLRRLWADLEAVTTEGMSAQDRDDLLRITRYLTNRLAAPSA